MTGEKKLEGEKRGENNIAAGLTHIYGVVRSVRSVMSWFGDYFFGWKVDVVVVLVKVDQRDAPTQMATGPKSYLSVSCSR